MTAKAINPFLLPAATTSRFILLIAITLSSGGYAFDLVAGGASHWQDVYRRCDRAADNAATRLSGDALASDYLSCLHEINLERGFVSLGAMFLVAVTVIVVYAVRPWLTIRRQKLVSPLPVEHASLLEAVRRLAQEEGLSRPPQVLLDMNRKTVDGRAFGRYPNYYLRLNYGVILDERTSGGTGTVDSVVLHELAHLRNRDVDITNLTLASVWAFVLAVATPLLMATALVSATQTLIVGAQLSVSAVLIVVLAAAVLRSREHYADVRAALSGGRLIAGHSSRPGVVGWLRRAVPMHPRAARRAKAVESPEILMSWVASEALGAGVAAGLGIPYLSILIGLWLGSVERYGELIASVVYGLLVTAVVGAGACRATLCALVKGRQPPRGVAPGVALAAGVLLGTILSPAIDESWVASMARAPLITAVLFATLVVICLLFTRWLSVAASAWLPVASGKAFRPVLLTGLVPGTLAFGLWLGVWYSSLQGALDVEELFPGLYVVGASFFDGVALTGLCLAWLYPLASWLRFSGVGVLREVHLGHAESVALPHARVRPFLAMAPAVAVLLIILAANLLTPSGVLVSLASEVAKRYPADAFHTSFAQAVAIVLAVVLAQLLAAVIVAVITGRRREGLGPAHGVFAALTTAAVSTGALVAPNFAALCGGLVDRCEPTALLDKLAALFLPVTAVGMPITMLGVGAVSGLRGLIRAARRRVVPPTPAPAPAAWLRRGMLVFVCVSAMVWTFVMTPAWLGNNGLVNRNDTYSVPDGAMAVPPPKPPGARAVTQACAEATGLVIQPLLGGDYFVKWTSAFVHLAESDRPSVVAFGRAGYAAARSGNPSKTGPLISVVTRYCQRV